MAFLLVMWCCSCRFKHSQICTLSLNPQPFPHLLDFVDQALGLEVRSVLAIGGIGGLAIGLAGREICENLLNGFLLMTTVSRV